MLDSKLQNDIEVGNYSILLLIFSLNVSIETVVKHSTLPSSTSTAEDIGQATFWDIPAFIACTVKALEARYEWGINGAIIP